MTPAERPGVGRRRRPSIWAAIHPRLLELIRAHRSTLIFVNSRRLAERLAGALNELAGETLVRSHHGSIARAQRVEVEDLLKAGALRALVATSSLELGIDMGAIDLVVQIEAPPSVASGLQRIGRGGHQANAVSEGVIFPKFRGDLVASAAVAKAMHDGAVEATRYPRNPLDIVAQQVVAMVSMDTWDADELFATIRRAAPFAELSRTVFDGVLDMLSGRYPSDEFAELRPRVTWDRLKGTITAREGAKRVAIANGGTIPDRGLYGVFLAGSGKTAAPGSARVGELDEEMVFESRVGETFVLGASSWRIEEITHDRVLVSPAPGEPGKMPFWKGDRAGRPLELGLAIGRLMHDLMRLTPAAAVHRLDARSRSRRARRGKPAGIPQRSGGRDARASRRGHHRHRARARRARRLARLRALAARRTHSRAVGDGGGGEDPRGDRRRRRDAVGRRRVRGAVSRCRSAARTAAAAARSGRSAGARRPPAWRDGAVRGEVSRERGAVAAAAETASRHARPAVAAAQARRRSAGRRVAVRIVPGPARDLSRMPARLLRHAGAHRHAGRRPEPEDPRRDRRFREAVAVCGLAALQLRRELSVRRRRAARRAARAGARRRSGAAARAARRRGAPRAARRRVDGRDRAAAAAPRLRVPRQKRRRRPRHAAGASAISPARSCSSAC